MIIPHPGLILVLAGPTGVGKTAISISIAAAIGAENVSADSRQIYRELNIGVAKPTEQELAAVPHHFISERSLDDPWSAGKFARDANQRIGEIQSRGATPFVVGGSTLYLDALIHGLADIPDVDSSTREQLNDQVASSGGAQTLLEELQRIDPHTAKTLDVTKTQRLVRAVGVYRTSGLPLSSFFENNEPPPYRYRVVVLTRPRAELYARIEARVDAMMLAGLLEENQRLIAAGHRLDKNPLRTIGYQEPYAHLSGEIDYDEMVRLLKRNSRRYAKRQLTWFRHHTDYEWIDLSEFGTVAEAADAILYSR